VVRPAPAATTISNHTKTRKHETTKTRKDESQPFWLFFVVSWFRGFVPMPVSRVLPMIGEEPFLWVYDRRA
jgi:hypothetical protein